MNIRIIHRTASIFLTVASLAQDISPASHSAGESSTYPPAAERVFLEETLVQRLLSFRRATHASLSCPRTWEETVEGIRQAVAAAQKVHFRETNDKATAWKVQKEKPEDLALLGGRPTFEFAQRVGLPTYAGLPLSDWTGLITDKLKTLHSGQIVNGTIVKQLEERLRDLLKAGSVVTTNSGSTALMTAIRAMRMSGKTVVVPDLTFAATSQAAHEWGARLAFGDTEPGRATLSPEATRALLDRISPDQRGGVLVVGLWGQRPDLDAFAKISEDYGIPILVDAAQALGTQWVAEAVAKDMVVVGSFSPTKKIGGAGGGWIATHNAEMAKVARLIAHDYGMKNSMAVDVGSNFRMADDSAAMALQALNNMDAILDLFQKRYAIGLQALKEIPGLEPALRHDAHESEDFQYFLVKNDPLKTGLTFEQIRKALEVENIFVQAYYPHLLSEMPAYTGYMQNGSSNARQLIKETFAIPLSAGMQEDDVRAIFNVLSLVVRHSQTIVSHLSQNPQPLPLIPATQSPGPELSRRLGLPPIGLGTAGWSPEMHWPENTDARLIGAQEVESIILEAASMLKPLLFDTSLSYPGAFAIVIDVLRKRDLLAQSLIIGKAGEIRMGENKWTDYSAESLIKTAHDLVAIAGRPLDAFLLHMPSYVDKAVHLKILRDPTTRGVLETLRQKGLMRWIGVSISDDDAFLRAFGEGLLDGLDIVEIGAALAIRYGRLVEYLGNQGIAIVVNSPRRHAIHVNMTPDEMLRKLLSMAGITTVLIGPKSMEELRDTLTTLKSANDSRLLIAA